MNIKQLRYFCKVVETGSASQAAKMLDLAPAAISMQISSLEKELNGELFNRSSRPMTLTRLGEFIYQRAPEIIFNIEKLEKDAWQYVNSKSITLTLGFVRSVMFNLIPETIKYFADTHGHIEINLKEVLSEYQPELLLNHELDIGFTREMDNDNFIGHELNHELILIDPLIAAIPKNHYLSKKKYITLRDFCNSPFIIFPSDPKSGYSLRVFEKFDEYGIRPAVSHRVVEIHTALALVGAGLGVTLVGKTTIPNNRQDIIFLPIEDFRCLSYIYAVYNPKNTNPNIHAFIDTMKKIAE
ncbi:MULTISPECIES: LysR family transcriptional regulator [unclassified Symbiopectobacterium]|uniref:LysR family transcriptional regulator n=1 Tax=unclassified Symbiopectobacterium TaxID=2794573 RepID=UPI002225CA97|nr:MULTISPECIES: LysR family transcriptional regulator [unclassified Symbiopectobacterium]MCW2476745.1 LysR family transcriptional regulator [Candidatus Symbiopectobacterium sp. NZEC151]MCW2482481.1 LysR family transcriptional regulator [Candidatus Symbiopectobacterium sp. NZEC135]MCW2488009.1 LysR family transcriptional regulator [Candidatus Symbiopectobacterium sp. NZEC127]